MKKIFLAVLTLCLLTLNSVANADDDVKLVRVSNFTPQEFIDRMGGGVIYQSLRQQGTLIAFTEIKSRSQFYDAKNFPGVSVWGSLFGVDGAPNPEGEIRFFIDTEGYVFIVQFLGAGDEEISGMVLLMVMEALGLNEQEVDRLLKTSAPTAEVWCANTKRRIIRQVSDDKGKFLTFFGAVN